MTELTELHPIKFQFDKKAFILEDEWKKICLPRLEYAASLKIPHLIQVPPHRGTCVIVGAGPSVENFHSEISRHKSGPFNIICSINGTHEWLLKKGIVPNIHVIVEYDLEHVFESLGGGPSKKTTYYICSLCNENIFDELSGNKRVLWHAAQADQEYQDAIVRLFPNDFMIGAGHLTLFRVLSIAWCLGFRNFELYGTESSFEGDSDHLKGYQKADLEPECLVWGNDERTNQLRKFRTNATLAFQAHEFLRFCSVHQAGISLRIHGDGLLRYVHESSYPEQYLRGNSASG